MQIPLKQGILGASTIILSKDIDKYASMCGSNFYESDVSLYPKCCRGRAAALRLFFAPKQLSEGENIFIVLILVFFPAQFIT